MDKSKQRDSTEVNLIEKLYDAIEDGNALESIGLLGLIEGELDTAYCALDKYFNDDCYNSDVDKAFSALVNIYKFRERGG